VKFLADMGVSMTTVDLLRQAGEAVVHLRDEGLHRLPDGEILEKARRE
jgi:predicted nuclease of predicted toxin-antitoxin system